MSMVHALIYWNASGSDLQIVSGMVNVRMNDSPEVLLLSYVWLFNMMNGCSVHDQSWLQVASIECLQYWNNGLLNVRWKPFPVHSFFVDEDNFNSINWHCSYFRKCFSGRLSLTPTRGDPRKSYAFLPKKSLLSHPVSSSHTNNDGSINSMCILNAALSI